MMRVLGFVLGALAALAPVAPETGPRYGTRVPVPGIGGTIVLCGEGDAPVEAFAAVEAAGDVLTVGADHAGVDADDVRRANAVWVRDGANRIERAALASALRRIVERGGAVGLQGDWAVDAGELAVDGEALGLLPGAVVWAGDVEPVREMVREHRGLVGYSIPRGTALVVRGRRARAVGRGTVEALLPASRKRQGERVRVGSGRTIDLITLSRASASRTGALFPPREPASPEVPSGTLFIGGGGRLPWETVTRFVAEAGGAEATIVVIPTALGGPSRPGLGARDAQMLRRAGARNVVVRHATTPEEAETDAFLEPLREAGGVWFSGGRQWRLVDSYLDTGAHELMRQVLARGGAVSGSSAGASIQAEYMVRGHPLGNRVMMAEGYERGLGLLPGAAIDQHFTQRNRFPDMSALKRAYPQLLGIGIDEGTVAVVSGHVLEVVGDHRVAMFDRAGPAASGEHEYVLVESGQRYDLRERRVIDP